jgi:hypothetical protein
MMGIARNPRYSEGRTIVAALHPSYRPPLANEQFAWQTDCCAVQLMKH